jgi:hypothetical protein
VIRFALPGGTNVLKELPEQWGSSGEERWLPRGGHRLWAAPERISLTYAPDNEPVELEGEGTSSATLTQAVDRAGIRKQLEITLPERGAQARLAHRLTNCGQQSVRVAAWAITMMAPGGTAMVPLPAKAPHPGGPENARADAEYWPGQSVALWPFFDFDDRRWELKRDRVLLRHDGNASDPTKLGFSDTRCIGYQVGDVLFVKQFAYEAGREYPDRGCNAEIFANAEMVETESLGPLVDLAPGETIEHVETWSLEPLRGRSTDEVVRTLRERPLGG